MLVLRAPGVPSDGIGTGIVSHEVTGRDSCDCVYIHRRPPADCGPAGNFSRPNWIDNPHPAIGTDAVTGQSPSEFLRSELAAAVAVRHASAHVTTPGHSHLEGINGQARLHPRADRIADDA